MCWGCDYLNHGGGDTGLTAVGADLVLLGLGDDGASVLALAGVEAGEVGAGFDVASVNVALGLGFVVDVTLNLVEVGVDVAGFNITLNFVKVHVAVFKTFTELGNVDSVASLLNGQGVDGGGTEGQGADDLGELHCECVKEGGFL